MRISILFVVSIVLLLAAAVASANPVLVTLQNKTVDEASTITFNVDASAPDKGNTTFTVTPTLGTLTKLSNTRATFTYSPGFNDQGDKILTFKAQDGNSSNTKTIKLTINNVEPRIQTTLSFDAIRSASKDRNETGTGTLSITNNGNTDITTLTVKAEGFVNNTYKIILGTIPTSIKVGETKTITLQGYIPLSHPSSSSGSFEESPVKIGTLRVTASNQYGTQDTNADLTMEARSRLNIQDIIINGEDVNTGGKIDGLKPGDELDFTLTVKNTFSSRSDITLEDIDVRAFVTDDNFDYDDTASIGSIYASDDDEVTLENVVIPSDASGTYTLVIQVTGTDDNSALHSKTARVDLKVEREEHDMQITRTRLGVTTLACGEHTTDFRVTVKNVGKNSERNAALQVESKALNLTQWKGSMSISRDSSASHTFTIDVPQKIKPGTYTIYAHAYYDDNKELDRQSVTLRVPDCGQDDDTTPAPTTTPTTPTTTTQPTTPSAPVTTAKVVDTSTTSNFRQSTTYTALLVAVIVLIVLLLIVLGVVLMRH